MAVDSLKVKDCPDFKRRDGQRGTVVVVSGEGDHVVSVGEDAIENVVYKTVVYRSMTLDKYKELKEKDELPTPDYTTFLTRDAHQGLNDPERSEERYGTYNECPPGEYYLNSKKDGGGSSHGYFMFISDNDNNKKINGEDGERTDIAIHQYDKNGSKGCLTLASGNEDSNPEYLVPVERLRDEIPDLFVHSQLENTDYPIERRPVKIILEEREVIEETMENGKTKWTGFVENT